MWRKGMQVRTHNNKDIRYGTIALTKFFSNQLRAGGVHRHDNINVCDRCHNEQYGPAKVKRIKKMSSMSHYENIIGVWTSRWKGIY